MDFKKYDKLRKKIVRKDFENNNKNLDRWLFNFSFLGNLSAMFFAYFLVFPSLLNTISLNFVSGNTGKAIAFGFSFVFLIMFEIVKRYFVRNFASDFEKAKNKISKSNFGWLIITLAIIVLSFYLSIAGGQKLAEISLKQDKIIENQTNLKRDSLKSYYDNKIAVFEVENKRLREANNEMNRKVLDASYNSTKELYQKSVTENNKMINQNLLEIDKFKNEYVIENQNLTQKLKSTKDNNVNDENKIIFLFLVIVIFNELIIIGGIYFREYYEHRLYLMNKDSFEKIYEKRDRYKILLSLVYLNGNLDLNNSIHSVKSLIEIIEDKSNIKNGKKIVDEFYFDMESMGVIENNGKRRYVRVGYDEALKMVDEYDQTYEQLKQLK